MEKEEKFCESCAVTGERVLAVGHCKNPDFSGYNLCQECIDEYDSRPHGIIGAGITDIQDEERK